MEKPGVHLFWIVSGTGTLEAMGNRYALRPGNRIWFIDMTHPRIYRPADRQRLVKRGLRFGGPGLESWHEQFGGVNGAEFELEDPSSIHYGFREIWQIAKRKSLNWEWRVHMSLTRILGELLTSRNILSPTHVELPSPVLRVINAIAANPFFDWKVRDLAPIAGISYSGLRTLFQQAMKRSLHDYLQRSRLDQARLLLADPRLSAKQIAEQLHFSSEFYFSHFFRKWGGMTPTDFRRQVLQPK